MKTRYWIVAVALFLLGASVQCAAPTVTTTVAPVNPAPGSQVTITVAMVGPQATAGREFVLGTTCEYMDTVGGVDTMVTLPLLETRLTTSGTPAKGVTGAKFSLSYPEGWTAPTVPVFNGFTGVNYSFGASKVDLTTSYLPAGVTGTATWKMTLPQ